MSSFDVNILQDALTSPNLPLTFPLPNDSKSIINLEANEEIHNSFSLIGSFVKFFTNINYDQIYSTAESKVSINKHLVKFNKTFRNYLDDRLKHSDEQLDNLVYSLIDQELGLKLIKPTDFAPRYKAVKDFMVKYYTKENQKNMPDYPTNLNFLKIAYITVIKVISKMFPNGIWVNSEQFNKLYQTYLEDPMSIIFLPNHQSHIDYIILHLITIRFQLAIPTVIAGENLNVAIFGKLLKNLGAIFIKRSFNNELYTERNLENLIEFVLLNKVHLEVFIEGTRSRDGKLLLPKYGILKTLSKIYLKQRSEKNVNFDLLMQPVAITYERIYEADGYFDELMGKDKKQESSFMIVKNGVSNLIYGVDKDDEAQNEMIRTKKTYDNSKRQLHGKIFVVLGDNFRISDFIQNDQPNLKKLGFKVLHEVNKKSVIPDVSLVGSSILIYYYLHDTNKFKISDVLPTFRILVNQLSLEQTSEHNIAVFENLRGLSEPELEALFTHQIIKFFRYVKVRDNTITVKNSIELLYYKNKTVHLLIHKCLTCFILMNSNDIARIKKLFYIFTGFLKNEFLFDHNDNAQNELMAILQQMVHQDVIDEQYNITDQQHIKLFSSIVRPFIESYMICAKYLIVSVNEFYSNITSRINEQQLINDDLMSEDYPTTKTLLRIISRKEKTKTLESVNKQYLLSCLFYFAHLNLIKIFKNKSRTKAFVIIKKVKDVRVLLDFLQKTLAYEPISAIEVNYIIDVIEKNPDRTISPKL